MAKIADGNGNRRDYATQTKVEFARINGIIEMFCYFNDNFRF